MPLTNRNKYSATLPPPKHPDLKKDTYRNLRKTIIYFFIVIFLSFLLVFLWYLVEKGYLVSLG
jgi:hypothetical protein